MRNVFVVTEMAMSLMLRVSAALMVSKDSKNAAEGRDWTH
jgi:hypothetical protein